MTAFLAQHLPYTQTQAFSPIATDYVAQTSALQPFYQHAATIEGIKNAIAGRAHMPTNRAMLVAELKKQYEGLKVPQNLQANIDALLQENTFTVTTAHQPNIFTGHLYFIYKILHAIRLAETLQSVLPGKQFVPVYYMGSEDADLEELGVVSIDGKEYRWNTKQQGAVGRMKVDKDFLALIDAMEGQLSVEPHGEEILSIVRNAYVLGTSIEQATFRLVHELFGKYGLVILLPDNAALKSQMIPLIRKELQEQFSSKAVSETMAHFPEKYKVQAAGRDINLFYLKDTVRERIEKAGDDWVVVNTDIRFSTNELLAELEQHPERFSPNVILRPVYQELILPNIAFIGGGGELAYWLELKKVFEAAAVPYPVLVLRNSFLIVTHKAASRVAALQMDTADFFKATHVLMLQLVKKSSVLQLDLNKEKEALEKLYGQMELAASAIDPTLTRHTRHLYAVALKKVEQLEKKMLVAEKKKFEAQQRQVQQVKATLFPNGSLQERVDNLLPYYARTGPNFIQHIYQNSLALEQQFCILTEQTSQPAAN